MNRAWRLFLCACLVLGLMALPAVVAGPVHAATCTELIADGGFETGGAWQLGPNPIMPQYVTYTRHGGNQALALGITSGANIESYSSARQTVTIPPATAQTTLSFWFYAMAGSPATTDYMEVVLLDATGSSILAKPWYSHNDSRLWNQMSFDLTPLHGQTVQLYFNVYNDGLGGKAAMFLDDVSLQACAGGGTPTPTGTSAPTATPTGTAAATTTPTITPSPTPGCVDVLVDGKFDNGLASWQVVGDPAGAAPVNAPAPVRSAPYALKLGSLDQNLNGLTTVRQLVTIPTGYPQVTLEAWVYTQAQAGPGADYQQVALLNSSGGLLYVPWQVELNNPAWQQLTFNVSAFAGQPVFVSFSVNNDGAGGRTAMFVDDARLLSCVPGAAATATPTPTGTPTVPVTATPTGTRTPVSTAPPVTPGCIPLLRNGDFESVLSFWTVPWNPLLPQIVTAPVVSGTFALQVGSQTQNASSYSSARQAVTIPWTHPRVILSFWTYTWAESLSDTDRQQMVLLAPDNSVLARPWSVLEDEQMWRQHVFDIIGMAGQTFAVYFNVINDGAGGRTAMFVDEAQLWACTPGRYPAELAAAPVLISAAGAAAAAAPTADLTAERGMAAASAAMPPADVTRVALGPSTQLFAGTPAPRVTATGTSAETLNLLNSILPPGSLKWLAIILAAILVIVVIWLLWPRR